MRPEAPRGGSSRPARTAIGALTALSITCGLAAAPVADAATRVDRVERAVVKRLNGIRAGNGLAPLRLDRRLVRAADAHSADMARRAFFSHSSSDGTPFEQRILRYTRKRETGETLAYLSARQRRQAARVVQMWMASPGHRQALMAREFRRIGVAKRTGVINGQRSLVFTADLATPR